MSSAAYTKFCGLPLVLQHIVSSVAYPEFCGWGGLSRTTLVKQNDAVGGWVKVAAVTGRRPSTRAPMTVGKVNK